MSRPPADSDSLQLELLGGTRVIGEKRGAKILLVIVEGARSFDLGSEFAVPEALYPPGTSEPGEGNLRELADFEQLARSLLQSMIRASFGRPEAFSTTILESMGAVLQELIRNTEQWARSDGIIPLRPSVRGYRVELHANDVATHRAVARDLPPLLQYLNHADIVGPGNRQRLVELSVFDNGPGITARVLADRRISDPSVEDEYAALVECLRWRYTSDPSRNRGVGLDLVLQMLTELSGFLRIRTGRLAVFRDFLQNPYTPGHPAPGLQTWPATSAGGPMSGSVLTMIFPIRYA